MSLNSLHGPNVLPANSHTPLNNLPSDVTARIPLRATFLILLAVAILFIALPFGAFALLLHHGAFGADFNYVRDKSKVVSIFTLLQSCAYVPLLGAAWFWMRKFGTFSAYGFQRPSSRTITLTAITIVTLYVILDLGVAVIGKLTHHPLTQDVVGQTHDPLTLGIIFIGIVVLGPLFEETVFRYLIFNGLRDRISWWGAALVSSTIFGLMHFNETATLPVLIPFALMGFVLCWIYRKTGNAWSNLTCHVTINLCGAVSMLFQH